MIIVWDSRNSATPASNYIFPGAYARAVDGTAIINTFVTGIEDVWTVPDGGDTWTVPDGGDTWTVPTGAG